MNETGKPTPFADVNEAFAAYKVALREAGSAAYWRGTDAERKAMDDALEGQRGRLAHAMKQAGIKSLVGAPGVRP